MLTSPLHEDRMAAALYVGASARRDCCAGCRHSRIVTYERAGGRESLRCELMRCSVGKGAVCALWQPPRRVIELTPTP